MDAPRRAGSRSGHPAGRRTAPPAPPPPRGAAPPGPPPRAGTPTPPGPPPPPPPPPPPSPRRSAEHAVAEAIVQRARTGIPENPIGFRDLVEQPPCLDIP